MGEWAALPVPAAEYISAAAPNTRWSAPGNGSIELDRENPVVLRPARSCRDASLPA